MVTGGRRPRASRLRSRSAPYQRLVAQSALSPAAQVTLQGQYEALNPLQLRRQIDSALAKLWPLGRTWPGPTHDPRATPRRRRGGSV